MQSHRPTKIIVVTLEPSGYKYIIRTHTQLSNPVLQQYWDWLKEKYEKY